MQSDREVIRRQLLRSFTRLAHREADCYNCHQPIFAGDVYHAEITAVRIRFTGGRTVDRIVTWKRHAFPCRPPEEYLDRSEALEVEDESEHLSEEDLPAAA